MKSRVFLVVISILLIAGLLVSSGCTTTPASGQTLKIGVLQGLNWVIGLDAIKGMDVYVEMLNKNGGIDIGGQKYKVELVTFDHKLDMALVKAGAEKLIYQDKVKYIIGECFSEPAIPLAEQNKVVLKASMYNDVNFDPKLNWQWSGAGGSTLYPSVIPLLAKRMPGKKTILGVFPDRFDGHASAVQHEKAAKSAGLTWLEPLFYMATATDLSSYGTKIKQMNPDLLDSYGGGPPLDAGAIRAAYAAGWRGTSIGCSTAPAGAVMGIAGPEAADGFTGLGWPTEFEPATTQVSKDWKAAYIAKNGKWDDPEIVVANELWMILAAMQKAKSIDPEKVKPVLDGVGGPLQFESICGTVKSIPRPDVGNSRTVDITYGNFPLKQIKGGKINLLETISLKEMEEIAAKMYGIK